MNESQTRLLIQRELDGNLSQEEEMRLRRVLMVNDSAVSFRANLSQIVAAVHELELPDSLRPGDSSRLAIQILDSLPSAKANFWDPILDIFGNRKSGKNDPRSTRSVASNPAATARSGKGSGVDSSQRNKSIANSGSQSKIDPAVLAPKRDSAKDSDKERTPHGLQAVDQYVTGTHSALGGLGKKLNINKNNAPLEEVGKTLADAIREKVHEHLREEAEHCEHGDQYHQAESLDSQERKTDHQADYSMEQNRDLPVDLRAQLKAEIGADFSAQMQPALPPSAAPAAVLPVIANPPNIVPASITTKQVATSVNLGDSMVLTVGPQNGKPVAEAQKFTNSNLPTPQVSGHHFSNEELSEWKSGAYPIVPPQAKPRAEIQTETGPLVPFSVNTAPNIAKLNLKDTAEIMKQLAADSQRERSPLPQWTSTGSFNNEPMPAKPAAWPITTQPEWPTPATEEATPIPQSNASAQSWNAPPVPDWIVPSANPTQAADPWAPQAATTPQPFQNPWAPPPVQMNTPVPVPVPAPVAKTNSEHIQTPTEIMPGQFPEPKIVPVTRQSALPLEAIGDRINELFNEPIESKPPTTVEQPAIHVEHPRQNSVLENDVNQCLASLGRLADVKYATDTNGKIKELGRFLLTDDTIEKIDSVIKRGLGHSHARVVTLDAAQQMASALEPILKFAGVVGYMVCGYDGLPITSALPHDVDIELLGGCSLVSYMNSHHIIKVMGHSHIRQIVMQMPAGCMILADFGKGILVTLTNEKEATALARLSETIDSITGT